VYIALHTYDVQGGCDPNATCHTMGIELPGVSTVLLNILSLKLITFEIITKTIACV
jgi:hypothetical protein